MNGIGHRCVLNALMSQNTQRILAVLIFKQLILGLLLPAVVTGGILVFARSLVSKEDGDGTIGGTGISSGCRIAVALGAGYIVGYIGLEGLPPFPPREGVQWLPYFAVLGGILGCFWHLSLWGRVCVQAVLSIAIPRLLLNSAFKYTWGPLEGIVWWVCLAAVIFIFWHLVQQSFTLLPTGAARSFVYFGISGGTALILAVSGTLRLAQHGGILLALFAVSWIMVLVLQRRPSSWDLFPSGASPVVTLLLAGIWMNGYFFEEVPAASAVLLAISLLFAPIGRIAVVQRLGAWRSTLVQIAAIALPVLIAIGIAIARSGLFGDSSGY